MLYYSRFGVALLSSFEARDTRPEVLSSVNICPNATKESPIYQRVFCQAKTRLGVRPRDSHSWSAR
jgi:hypothetical protein